MLLFILSIKVKKVTPADHPAALKDQARFLQILTVCFSWRTIWNSGATSVIRGRWFRKDSVLVEWFGFPFQISLWGQWGTEPFIWHLQKSFFERDAGRRQHTESLVVHHMPDWPWKEAMDKHHHENDKAGGGFQWTHMNTTLRPLTNTTLC